MPLLIVIFIYFGIKALSKASKKHFNSTLSEAIATRINGKPLLLKPAPPVPKPKSAQELADDAKRADYIQRATEGKLFS